MHSESERAIELLRLSDQAFFTFDEDAEERILDELIVMNVFEGTAIGAPSTVDVGEHQVLPLLWLRRESGLRHWQVEAMRNSTIVVADCVRGTIALWDAFRGPKMLNLGQVPRSASGERPPSNEAEGATADADLLDLRSIANLSWEPGRLAATLILHDWVSNTVKVDLTRPGPDSGPARIPAEEARALDEAFKQAQSQPRPLFSLLSPGDIDGPNGPGVVLSEPTGFPAGEGRSFLRCGVRVALAEGMLVAPPEQVPPDADPLPGAIVEVLLLFAGLDEPRQRTIRLRFPLHPDVPPAAGDPGEVAFELDLDVAFPEGLPPGAHQIYLIAGEHIAGPRELVVPE